MINKHIIIYYKKHYDKKCPCSYCVNKKGIIASLQKLDYSVEVKKFNCDWPHFFPADRHFDYALSYQNKIFGEFMFEADKMPAGVIEFAQTYFDFVICGSKFLYNTWLDSGVDKRFLIPASLGIDTNIFNHAEPTNILYPDTFKFLSVGAWQHNHWHDRKGFTKLIASFKRLYSKNKKVMLIIKTNENAPKDIGIDNIKFIRENLSDNDMANLYKSCAINGAYVSLHSGEGFGRTDLEALSCGCHIGATGWSGVLDFLNKDNATLFPYTFTKSKLYTNDYYSNNVQPNVAQVNIKAVEKWMLDIVKQKDTSAECIETNEYNWGNVVKNLMKEINGRI